MHLANKMSVYFDILFSWAKKWFQKIRFLNFPNEVVDPETLEKFELDCYCALRFKNPITSWYLHKNKNTCIVIELLFEVSLLSFTTKWHITHIQIEAVVIRVRCLISWISQMNERHFAFSTSTKQMSFKSNT